MDANNFAGILGRAAAARGKFTETQRALFKATAARDAAESYPLMTLTEARQYGVVDPVERALTIIRGDYPGLDLTTLDSCEAILERRYAEYSARPSKNAGVWPGKAIEAPSQAKALPPAVEKER